MKNQEINLLEKRADTYIEAYAWLSMNCRFFKFMFCLSISTLIIACTTGNIPIVPTPTLITPALTSIPPTRVPVMTAPTISETPLPTLALALPTFSFNSTPLSTPTSVGKGPFKVVAGIDEIFPESQWAYVQPEQNGTIWLLTDKGIARVSDSGWTVYLTGYEGHVVGIDSTNRVWVVNETGDSISAWDGTKWTKYSSENGWATVNDPSASSFDELPGQIWLATREDVRLFDGVRWKIININEIGMTLRTNEDINLGPPIFRFLEIEAIQSTGEVWVGECDSEPFSLPYDGSGARWFDGKSWQGKSTPVESGCVHAIQEDKAGNIWMAVNFSLWHFTPATQEWVNFTLTEFSAYSRSFIISLAISDAGEPWLITQAFCGGGGYCTPKTLYHLVDNVWRPVGVDVSHGILIDLADHAWLVSTDSIYTIIDDQSHLVSNLMVNDWTMDATGRIWVIGKAGQKDKDSLWLATP